MNVTTNVNAKTTNVMDNFNPCKEYTNFETDAFLVAATLEYFGMQSLEETEESVIPRHILNGSKNGKRIWLHRHAKNILEKFVTREQQAKHKDLRDAVFG